MRIDPSQYTGGRKAPTVSLLRVRGAVDSGFAGREMKY
jgi:hypothetical protein